MDFTKMTGIAIALLSPFLFANAQDSTLPFSFTVAERTEDLPEYVSPPGENLYNSTPGFKVGWGIDYPIGFVAIERDVWTMFNVGNQYGTTVRVARYKGTDFEHATRQPDGVIQVPETGISTHFLGGLWCEKETGTLYAPIHCEYDRSISPPAGWTRKKTRLATSTDMGLTWRLEGDILTAHLPEQGDWLDYSGSYFEAGPADFDFYADERGGYFYIYSCNAYAPKNGTMNNFLWFNEVARCAIKDRMAPGAWKKFCNGKWTEPGLGGKSSRVCMGSTGIYGRTIYSTYLRKYLRIGTCMGVIDKRYSNLGFSDGSIYVSYCSDLSRQEWSPMAKLFDKPNNDKLGFTVADGKFVNPFVCGRDLHVYNYWLYNLPSRALDVHLGEGITRTAGFPRYGSYAYEPLPESGDSIVSRKTCIVSCADSGTVFTGDGWKPRSDPNYYQSQIVECAIPGSTVQCTFSGTDIYWRAVADSDGGRADVYVDGRREQTVDCYFQQQLPYLFSFVKTGLSPGKTHTIKVVTRADRNPQSRGTIIRHMAFEHSSECYRASANFCGVNGKNSWTYRLFDGRHYHNLSFVDFVRTVDRDAKTGTERVRKALANWWGDSVQCRIGNGYQVSGEGEAVRTWRAPHNGSIRLDGDVHLDNDTNGTALARIRMNGSTAWETGLIGSHKVIPHKVFLKVKTGDEVDFAVAAAPGSKGARVNWDPVVRYVP